MIDLHTHTDRSDGTVSPEDLVRRAKALGLEALAIADHDTLAGYDLAQPFAARESLELICAVELSTRPDFTGHLTKEGKRPRSVHILGYFLNTAPSATFRDWLLSQQASRRRRNLDLIEKLRQLGVHLELEEMQVYGRNQVGRPHFARVLLDKGYVSTLQEAFDRYLADDAEAAVERDEPSLEEGIRRICEGGGLASLAHPVRLPQRDETSLCSLLDRLRSYGLRGIEIYHSEHNLEDAALFRRLAERLHLIETGGSDFHGDAKPEVRLGSGVNGNVALTYDVLERMRSSCSA
jgi:hypothetical protein